MTEPTPNPSPVLRPAETAYPIHPLIAGRWSGRAIDPDRPVDDALLRRLLEAARWAPSAFNNQPWAYLVVTSADPEALAKARATLSKGNAWALAAPVLIFSLAETHTRKSKRPNRRHLYELGMATAQMALQAAEEGLVFHQMAGFDPQALREAFGIGEAYALMTAVAVGYPGDPACLDEKSREREKRPRLRRAQMKWVRWNGWEG